MRIHSKLALASLTLLVALPLAFAQNAAQQAPPSPSQSQAAMQGQFRQHPMARRGEWGHKNSRRMHRRGRHDRGLMLARLVRNPSFRERLGVTPEQAQKIQTQTFNFQKARIENRANLAEKRLELRNQLTAVTPDRNAIDTTLQEMSAARLTQQKSAIHFRLDMRASLTPDQWQKLRQMRQEFRHRDFHRQGPNGLGSNGRGPEPNTNG